MKTTFKRTAHPYKAVFGFDVSCQPEVGISSSNELELDIGWISLQIGRDHLWNEYVLACTPFDSFFMGVGPGPAPLGDGRHTGEPWVYAMKEHPVDLFLGNQPATMLSYAGMVIGHAADKRRGQFLTLSMPSRQLSLVFRNPRSRSTRDWKPARPALLTKPGALAAIDLSDSTGDAELDALLGGCL